MRHHGRFLIVAALGATPACLDAPDAADGGEGGTAAGVPTGASGSAGSGSTGGGTQGDDVKLDLGDPDPTEPATDGVCSASMIEGVTEQVPVDIVIVVDTSGSMGPATDAIENSLNSDFANILEDSGIDYRIIVIAQYGSAMALCLDPPLSAQPCDPLPADPATTSRYFHYPISVGSEFMLDTILSTYAPDGWSQWLRPDSSKLFLTFTDSQATSNDPAAGDAFDEALRALDAGTFDAGGEPGYVFHTVMGIVAKRPASEPWLPDDPLRLDAVCGSGDQQGPGGSLQRVAMLSGGWRFPVCHPEHFGVVFQQVAQTVVTSTPVSCSFAIPEPPPGETIDPDTIEIDVVVEDAVVSQLAQVPGLQACTGSQFYREGDTLHLCPAACDEARAITETRLEIRYGCDVGYDPAG